LRIAVLTGGGDCPGLNAAIRAVCQRGWIMGDEVYGIHWGWSGLMGEGEMHKMTPPEVRDILDESGTMLGTSRTNPGKSQESLDIVRGNLERHHIDGLVAIGGDDTLSVAAKLDAAGAKVVGIPKTIDNDVPQTDFCIGFDTATGVVADALGRLLSTAKSHRRVIVTEIMGRQAGWLALIGGLAGGADFIAIPEVPVHIDEIVEHAKERMALHRFSVMGVAEGAQIEGLELAAAEVDTSDQFGHVRLAERGIAQRIADEIKGRTSMDTRITVLGHIQRGGTPSVRDRYIPTLMGSRAVEFLHRGVFGQMAALKGQEIVAVPLAEIGGKTRSVPAELYEEARRFFKTMTPS
jgi:ATP-dependent phosphofructokinase / diphosphate-dependent phosphofructokinase